MKLFSRAWARAIIALVMVVAGVFSFHLNGQERHPHYVGRWQLNWDHAVKLQLFADGSFLESGPGRPSVKGKWFSDSEVQPRLHLFDSTNFNRTLWIEGSYELREDQIGLGLVWVRPTPWPEWIARTAVAWSRGEPTPSRWPEQIGW